MIYIFSNARTPNETKEEFGKKIENQFKPVSDDKIVFLNTMMPYFCNKEFFNKFNLYSIHRGYIVGTFTFFFGAEELFRNRTSFEKSYFISHDDHITDVTVHQFDNQLNDQKDFKLKFSEIDSYSEEKAPTTGFLSYLLTKKLFDNEDITLVNFYGSSNNTTEKNPCHDWNYEEEFFKKIENKKIFI